MKLPAGAQLPTLSVVVACLLAGCGSAGSEGPSIDPVGSWSGSTSQGLPISFEVTSGGVTSATVAWHLSGSSCSYDATATISGGSPLPVANNAFTMSALPLDAYTTLSGAGRFTSSSTASGTLSISDTNCVGTLNGTWNASKATAATDQRILKQEALSLTGVLSNYWLYSYDGAGFTTQVRAYSAGNALLSTSDYTYAGGYRTLVTNRDTSGTVTSTQSYSYTSGVLSRSDFYGGDGASTGFNTYVFSGGRKLTTNRFSSDGASSGRTDFAYDVASGRRTGATGRDALGTVTTIVTRTYAGGLWTQSRLDFPSGAPSVIRKFTYETGPVAIDADIFFEF